MALASPGFLPDRPRPAWFGNALATLFIAIISVGFAGSFRTPDAVNTAIENRTVEPLPAFPESGAALREFPARFERAFDDRFGLRTTLVRIDHWVKAVVFGASPLSKVLIGKSGWLYFRGEDARALERWYRGTEEVPDATINALRDELLRRQAFLASRGIPYIFVIVPEKYSVYPEFLPDWATRITSRTPLDRLVTELARNPQLDFLDLRDPLRAAKGGDRLYFQTDSHWNYLGAMVGYRALMSRVQQVLPGLDVAPAKRPPYVPESDYYSGDLAQMLGLTRQFREADIAPLGRAAATAEARCAQRDTSDAPGIETYVFNCPNAPRFSAVVYRDSAAVWLRPLLPQNFSRTTFVSSPGLDPELIERLRPDIVIQELVERSLPGPIGSPLKR
jgi:alginate O-acetyltransferase complex protein AlgJ